MKRHTISRIIAAFGIGLVLVVLTLMSIHLPAAATAAQPPISASPPVCFVSNGQTACVDRPGLSAPAVITDQVRLLVQTMIAGPTADERANGVQSSLPVDTQLSDVSISQNSATINLILSNSDLAALTVDQVEDINEQFRTTFTPYSFKRIDVNGRAANGSYQPLSKFLAPIEIPSKTPSLQSSPTAKLLASGARVGLSGKTVFVSAGHGWYWNTTLNTYRTQRPVYPSAPYPAGEGIIEDFNNAEAVNQYLLQYLWNSGADAWTVRERDMNTNMVIVDDSSAGFSTQGAWTTNSGGYNGSYRSATTVNSSPTATATWTFTPPATDLYSVYVHFPTLGITRTVDAHYFVGHAGATTPVIVAQTRDGDNWRFVGRYPFYGGLPARIWLTNQSATPAVTVLADAVRIGGGIGDTSVAGAPVSNKPRWEEQSRQYAKWVGMPNVDNLNDVIVRPIYSEWEKDSSEDAVYIAWHTNGYNGYNTTTRGTESFIHSFQPTTNSDKLQNFVHTELLNDIHIGWDPNWPDLGKNSLDLGELRLLSTMPGMLIENGFHDNPIDVDSLKDPRFNQLSARAIYHGLVKYWHAQDPNVPVTFLPEPPQHVIVRNSSKGQIKIEWQPGPTDGSGLLGDAATTYHIYTSTDGFGWSNGVDVASTAYTINGLAPDTLIFVKITGLNAGGESFPSHVLAARVARAGIGPILIVDGFDRIDRNGDIQQNDPPEGYSRRMFIDRINRFDAVIQHADAITRPFDSAQHAAVSDASVGLANYAIVDWIAGEEQAPFTSLNANEQTHLTDFLNNGGALFMSGTKLGNDLGSSAFYANTLHAAYANADASTYSASPQPGSLFDGLGTLTFDDGTHGTYNVNSPNIFNPLGGASSALVYNTGGTAALQYAHGACTRLVYSGVPFETIYPQANRRAAMVRIINFLGPCLPVETTIDSPPDGADINFVPAFNGGASSNASMVQVSIRRVSDSIFYNGTSFNSSTEVWLSASGVNPWSYALPALSDDAYALRARAIAPGPITDTNPAAITFTLDTVPPATPTLITPTGNITILAVAPSFQWTGDGDTAHFTFELDGITTTVSGSVLSMTHVITDGPHQWRVRAIDAASNASNWSGIGQFRSYSLKAFLPIIVKNSSTSAPLSITIQ